MIDCFYGTALDSYQKNLLALGGESCSSCQEPASDSFSEAYYCMHYTIYKQFNLTKIIKAFFEKNPIFVFQCCDLNTELAKFPQCLAESIDTHQIIQL